VQTLLVSPEFGEAWQAFAGKVGSHGKEMRRIADGIYYPKARPFSLKKSLYRVLCLLFFVEFCFMEERFLLTYT
jgi:hypothetical protein